MVPEAVGPSDEPLPDPSAEEAPRSASPGPGSPGPGSIGPGTPGPGSIGPGTPGPGSIGTGSSVRARAPKIPGYRIEAVIGRGSTGVVYRAVQLAVERPVALKVLHPDLVGTRAVVRLQREARTTARLAHPGIVSAIDMGQVGGLWWYAMELVDGRSLAAILTERGSIGQREALRLFIPLCEALQHAFESGVVHRDIKPGNILVDRNRRARLVDLGLAFSEEDPRLTSMGGTLGTPFYISPEQARDPGAADVRSDIWSLGASLYHAVCGRPPFQGESIAEILSGVLYSRIVDPRTLQPRLSRDLALVLRKCLSREPEQRYQEPHELLADLERLVERRHVQVEPRELDPLLGEREWTKALWGGVLVLAVATVAGGAWWRTRGGPEQAAVVEAEVEPYAPLEALAARLNTGALLPGPALAEVERLATEVPPRAAERLAEVRALAHRDYNQALRGFQRRVRAALDVFGARRDLVGARRYLDVELEAELQRELGLGEQRLREELASDWVAEHRAQLDSSIGEALAGLRENARSLYAGVVLPNVESRLDRGEWRAAHEQLALGPADWLADADIDVSGLPAEDLEAALSEVVAEARARRAELEKEWHELDDRLAEFLSEESSRLTALLRDRNAPPDVGAALQAAFDARLADLGLDSSQALLDVGEVAWSTLRIERPGLEKLQRELFVEDAEAWFAREDERLTGLYARRDYAAAAEVWRAALGRGWPEPVHGLIAVREHEADLLVGLLERAAQGVLERSGEKATLFVGSIAATGVVEVRGDPLEAGFDLRTRSAGADERGGAHHLWLRSPGEGARGELLLPVDLERLAGFADGSAELEPADRLARVALRFYEGDVEGAAAVLAAGAYPGLEDVAADLRLRISRRRRGLAAQEGERLAEAERLYNLVKREALREHSHRRDAEQALVLVEELLRDYFDLEFVRSREKELRELRRTLRPAQQTPELDDALTRLYAADQVELLLGGRVRLEYSFDGADASEAWSRGDWRYDGQGWSAPGLRSREDLELDTRWPRLVLGPPLDLSSGVVDATLTFEQLDASGPPRLLLVSVAGVHVALAGAEEARDSRFDVATGREGLATLVATVPDGAGEPFVGLRRGARHVLHVELRRGRGRVRVSLDGREVATRNLSPPEPGEPGSASIVVRSLESVRLLRVELEAPVD